ncbi:MAG: metal-dependent hydrolase [Aigarchaeota archaeon]|nr:metal-dependent hydrolase [Aigarchaeota archaeon]MCX8192594.1 metal-dependent hydrolase [Nitrososphaeria archaeon]MDW7985670.1 metal-dependent hydrolase [Nitrososphaerota archaeon]
MVTVKWLGHSAFEIEIADKLVMIDPFLQGNPLSPIRLEDLRHIDVIVITHDHGDHFGDSVEIAKKHGSKIVSVYETANKALSEGVLECIGMNIGGTVKIDNLSITLTPAVHSMSSNPCGVVLSDGKTSIYHAGDTTVFGDMKIIGQLYKPTIALLPIGGFYTSGPREAAMATALIKPKIVIPMHYNTFDVIRRDPEEFKKEVKRMKIKNVKIVVLKPGESFKL